MSFIARLLVTLAATLLLFTVRRTSRARLHWPPPPLRLALSGLITWTLTAVPGLTGLVANQMVLITTGRLAFLYAMVSLVGWLLLDVPSAKRWWRTPPKIMNDLCVIIIDGVLTLAVLQQAGVSISSLITTSAFLTAVIGFAAQEPLKDMFGGLGLQLDQPFKEGDWIQIGELKGQVVSLTLMNTYIRSGLDGCTLIIPNDTVAQTPVRKITLEKPYGNCFEVGLDYAFPPSQAVQLLLSVVNNHRDVLSNPAPKIWIAEFADSSINYGIQVWHPHQGDIRRLQIRGELLEQIWYSLERIGQSIPFPIRTLTRRQELKQEMDPMHANHQQKQKWLTESSFFSHLKPEQIAELAPLTRCLRFAKGETVIRQGDIGDCCFHIIQGGVEVFQTDSQGKEQSLAHLGENQLFGEMAVCTNEARTASIRAIEETILLEVERGDLQHLIDADAALLEKLAHLVLERQQATGRLRQRRDETSSTRKNRLIRSMQTLYNVFRGGESQDQ